MTVAASSPSIDELVHDYLDVGFAAPLDVIPAQQLPQALENVRSALSRPGPAPAPSTEEAAGRLSSLVGSPGENPVPFVESRHLDDPGVHALCTAAPVLTVCRALLGLDLLLWRSTLIRKPPGGEAFRWHQDFGGVFDAGRPYGLEPPFHLNVWIALTETTRENGCLRFIPGNHHVLPSIPAGPGARATLLTQPEFVDESRAIDVPLKAGQAVVFGDRALHASWPNSTTEVRTALALRVTVPQVRVRPHFAGHACLLISGTDRLGVNRIAQPPRASKK